MENDMALIDAAMDDVSDFLPDGWQEDAVRLANLGNDPETFVTDGPTKDPEDLLTISPGSTDDAEDSTQSDNTEAEQTESDETEAQTENPDGEAKVEKRSRNLKLKVNRESKDVDIEAMDDDELAAIMQKGYAFEQMKTKYDALRDKIGQETYREVYQKQLDDGMSEDVAKLVAEKAAGKEYSLTEDVVEPTFDDDVEVVTNATDSKPEEKPAGRDFKAEYSKLRALYPELKTVPSEVVETAIGSDVSILEAYQAYQSRESKKTVSAENAELKKENSILKQNAASAKKAPNVGVSGAGPTGQKRDLFLEAFDSAW